MAIDLARLPGAPPSWTVISSRVIRFCRSRRHLARTGCTRSKRTYRAQVLLGSKVIVYSRRGLDWTRQFGAIADAAAGLQVHHAIFDGEAVVYGATGRPDFQALRRELGPSRSGGCGITPSTCSRSKATTCDKSRTSGASNCGRKFWQARPRP